MKLERLSEITIKLGSFKSQPGSPSDNFMQELWAETWQNPLNDRQRVIGTARVEMSAHGNNAVWMHDIQSSSKGDGTKALQFVCDLADKHDVVIRLTADGYHDTPTEVLIAWYKRHGFAVINDDPDSVDMMRRPK